MAEHSRIGASSAYRWFECPGSVGLIDLAPPQEQSKYAAQGTAAHGMIEAYFAAWKKDERLDVEGYTDPTGYEFTEDDFESVKSFINYVLALLKTGKYVLHSEVKFDLSSIYPGLFGTGDIVLMETNMKRLKVIDYKHGSGIPVEVKDNKQLMYYALGAIQFVAKEHKLDYLSVLGWGGTFNEVEITVAQPRCRHRDGGIRSWVVSGEKLEAFAEELKAAAALTQKKDAPFKTGDHCRFCPALSICRAFNDHTADLAQTDFKAISSPKNLRLPDPNALSVPELVKILNYADLISAWLAAVESDALARMEHGQEMPGYKLVQKKTNRQWKDEEEAKDALTLYVNAEDLYEKKLLTPAKAEKLLGKKQKSVVEELCFKPEGGNTIAPEHDPREAVKGSASSDFNALM